MRRFQHALGVVVAAVALGGCGSSSSSKGTSGSGSSGAGSSSTSSAPSPAASFTPGYEAAVVQFKATSMAIGAAIQNASKLTNAQIATTFGQLASSWGSTVSALGALTPPASVSTTFGKLQHSAAAASADLNAIVQAAKSGNSPAAAHASGQLVTDIVAAKGDAQSIDSKLGIKPG